MKKTLAVLILSLLLLPVRAAETNPAEENVSIVKKVEQWYEKNMNYGTITLLMTVESSFIPFPSEVVIPPAAYIASKDDSHLNIYLVVLFGTLGALLGAYINYFLALYLGRPILHKFADSKLGHLFLLSSEKIQKAEDYFQTHGKTSTFVGRLIPGIRQLISIPAGLAKMNLIPFTLFTFLGAGIWNVVLALLGYLAHGQADLIDKYSHEIGYIIMGLVVVAGFVYLLKKLLKKKTV
ncbi:MAG: DedA family protein [Paludibacter sp.]|nr:MAG: DedA family protein [Paludibacter sp.]